MKVEVSQEKTYKFRVQSEECRVSEVEPGISEGLIQGNQTLRPSWANLLMGDSFPFNDGLGMVPYVVAVLAAQIQGMELAREWLVKAFGTPDGKQLKLRALEEKELDSFWRKIGEL